MQPLNDDELHDLLRRWEAPSAPPAVERRIFGPRREPWRRWLISGSITVPVPVFVLLLVVLSAVAYIYPRPRPAAPASLVVRELKFSDFQPAAELRVRVIRRNHENN